MALTATRSRHHKSPATRPPHVKAHTHASSSTHHFVSCSHFCRKIQRWNSTRVPLPLQKIEVNLVVANLLDFRLHYSTQLAPIKINWRNTEEKLVCNDSVYSRVRKCDTRKAFCPNQGFVARGFVGGGCCVPPRLPSQLPSSTVVPFLSLQQPGVCRRLSVEHRFIQRLTETTALLPNKSPPSLYAGAILELQSVTITAESHRGRETERQAHTWRQTHI